MAFLLTLCLNNVGHVKAFAYPQYHCPILKVECITVKQDGRLGMQVSADISSQYFCQWQNCTSL